MATKVEKIGIFICQCGFNIGGVLDIKHIIDHFSNTTKYPDVAITENKYFCSDAGLRDLKSYVRENGIERIVIAACSMKMHGELFRSVAEELGINRFLVEFANIREQNAWVHTKQPQEATQKAIDQIDMALAKVRYAIPLDVTMSPVTQAAIVIGGGVAGIKAALALGDAGFRTYLVERQPTIGGHMALFDKTFPTLDCSICVLGPEMVRVKEHPNITLMTFTTIEQVSGFTGKFTVRVRKKARFVNEQKCSGCFNDCCNVCPVNIDDRYYPRHAIYVPYPQAVPLIPVIDAEHCIHCRACELGCSREAIDFDQEDEVIDLQVGTIIVATGYEAFDATIKREFGYGVFPDVITSLEMERMLNPYGPTNGVIIRPSTGEKPSSIAYILCVGARDEKVGNPWCSRVCCNYSTKQAVQLMERVPDASVTIFYTDLRAVGKGCEEFLNRSREEFGVKYIRGRVSRIANDDDEKCLIIEAEDTLVQKQIESKADLVVLATAMVPPRDTRDLAKILNISTGSDGFMLEDHLKMRPSQSTLKGIFLAGVAQGPKDIPDSIAHAESAASKAIGMLAKGFIEVDPRKIHYNEDKCIKCKICTQVCNFGALEYKNDRVSVISPNCTGCGACQAVCPTGALTIPGFTRDEVLSQIEVALKERKIYPIIIAFLCNWCSYAGADLAGTAKMQYPPNARVIHVMCSSMVDPLYIFTAFAKGADGVLVAGCYEQDCHYNTGFLKTRTRSEAISMILQKMDIDPRRFLVESVSAGEGKKFQKIMKEFTTSLKNL
ncbi:MAG TPA: hydrogenase iron-sulfur subunit [Candidatus Lokiarchaeia archaeon]|nr:hydrogenase iron-sulfur subunit [Candidatus Lokiarchaeia archaeon]